MTTVQDGSRNPKRNRAGFVCPRCGLYAQQDWMPLFVRVYADGDEWYVGAIDNPQMKSKASGPINLFDGEEVESVLGEAFEESDLAMAVCGHCFDHSVWRGQALIFPAVGLATRPHPDMPEAATVLFDEARSVVGASRRAGAAMARATLEVLLKTLQPELPKASLADRIKMVMPLVSSPLADMLTVIRHVGNKSLHAEETPDDAMVLVLDPDQTEIVELIFETINDLVDELITKPKRARAMHDLVPDRIRAAVKRESPTSE